MTLLLFRRELSILVGLAGQLANEALNWVLKRSFRHPRPTSFLGTGYAMPSSHAQFMGYFAAFWLLHLLTFRPGMAKDRCWSLIWVLRRFEHTVVVGLIVSLSAAVAYSRWVLSFFLVLTRLRIETTLTVRRTTLRYHLSYHTPLQIIVGAALGFAFGIAWYHVFETLSRRRKLFSTAYKGGPKTVRQVILEHPLVTALRIRDSWAVWDDGGVENEYGLWKRDYDFLNRFEVSRRYALGNDATTSPNDGIHLERMLLALEFANRCDPTTTAFSVGCVIARSSSNGSMQRDDGGTRGIFTTGYSRETPGNTHAEEVALERLALRCVQVQKKAAREPDDFLDLDLYTTMEPCSSRLSKKPPCVERILEFNRDKYRFRAPAGHNVTLRIARVFQGVKEPDDFVKCEGTRILRDNGIAVYTVEGPTKLVHDGTSPSQLTLHPGWLEREALRLAKKGQKDQAVAVPDEMRAWQEPGWRQAEPATRSSTSWPWTRDEARKRR